MTGDNPPDGAEHDDSLNAGDRLIGAWRDGIGRLAVVGAGRIGTALVAALGSAMADGPFGRGFDGHGYDVVLLAVPDSQIDGAATMIESDVVLGHLSGSYGLDVLAPHERFGVHPLLAVSPGTTTFAGASAAVAGSTPRALALARWLAEWLGMATFEVADADRAAYHAAASVASNFLVTLESVAESLFASTGADRRHLVPLVRATVDNWARLGSAGALTGPVARNDLATVDRQRAAIADRAPDALDLFDVMVRHTRALAETMLPPSGTGARSDGLST